MDCDDDPIVCGGTTECQVTLEANVASKCVWVKVDADDTSNNNRDVTLTTSDDRATATIKNTVSGRNT